MSKPFKLTNIQVPKDPKMSIFEAFRKAPPFDPNNHKNVGKVEKHSSTDSVINKMLARYEERAGVKLVEKEEAKGVNLKGINDDRKDIKLLGSTKATDKRESDED